MDISRVQTPCMPCSDLPMELGADIGGDLVPSWDLSLSNPFLDDDTPGDEDFQVRHVVLPMSPHPCRARHPAARIGR